MSLWTLKKVYYRGFQFVFNLGARCLPWRKAQRVEGPGSVGQIPALLQQEGVKKSLVVTTAGLLRRGEARQVTEALERAGMCYALYTDVTPNPTVEIVEAILNYYRIEQCDGFVAVGGGSCIDAAKGAAARVVCPKKTVGQLGGLLKVSRKIPPLIAVPTTAGSGSETTIAAVITDEVTHHKYAIMDLRLIPCYAVLDPNLTLGLPSRITAETGMDALTHGVEAYLCWTYGTRESIRCAEEAVVALFHHLERVWQNGQDMDGRSALLLASFQAGFAFTRAGVGNVHAIAHTLGGLYNTAHGLANAVILPIVLEDYGSVVYPKLARLAELTGVATCGDTTEQAQAFIKALYAMNNRMGLPRGFDFIQEEDIPQMAHWAFKEANPIYPVPVLYSQARFCKVIQTIKQTK